MPTSFWTLCFKNHIGVFGERPDQQLQEGQANCTCVISEWHYCGKHFGCCLGREERARMWKASRIFLVTYSALAATATSEGRPAYNCTYKLHAYAHMVDEVWDLGLNPKYFHCFADEDMVGRVAAVCKLVHRSTYAITTMERFRGMIIQKLHVLE